MTKFVESIHSQWFQFSFHYFGSAQLTWAQANVFWLCCPTKQDYPVASSNKSIIWYVHIHSFIEHKSYPTCVSQKRIFLQYSMIWLACDLTMITPKNEIIPHLMSVNPNPVYRSLPLISAKSRHCMHSFTKKLILSHIINCHDMNIHSFQGHHTTIQTILLWHVGCSSVQREERW